MTDVKNIKKKLVSIGLSEQQAEIYIFLLRRSGARIAEISEVLNLPRSSVYEYLKGLF